MTTKSVREERGTAVVVGALYVLATAAGVAAAVVGGWLIAFGFRPATGALAVAA